MMSKGIFNPLHSKYYDLTYAKKDYPGEVHFFDLLMKKFGPPNSKKVLSLGGGTLNHEKLLLKLGYEIHAIDQSEAMVKLAKQKIKANRLENITVEKKDMRDIKGKGDFDVALSMFNVVSYFKNIAELKKVFRSVSSSLKPNGIFIFDCWNAEAVKKDPPQSRFAKFVDGKTEIYRLTKANYLKESDSVNLEIELFEIINGKLMGRETENHIVKSWSVSEIGQALLSEGLSLVNASEFGDYKKRPNSKKWAMTIVARKIK